MRAVHQESSRRERSWRDDALCGTLAHQRKFTTLSDRPTDRDVAELKAVCRMCPVIAECDLFARRHQVTAGVWAGRLYGIYGNYDVAG